MRAFTIAILLSVAFAGPAAAQTPSPAGDATSQPAAQPLTRSRVENTPTLFDRWFAPQQQQAQQPPTEIQPAAQQAQNRRRADRRRAERPTATTQSRSARREARREARQARREARRQATQARQTAAAPQQAPARQTAAVEQAQRPIPLPPPHPERATEEAVAAIPETTVATGEDPTTRAYEETQDPRERCHVVLASEAEHDIAEVLRCRVMLARER